MFKRLPRTLALGATGAAVVLARNAGARSLVIREAARLPGTPAVKRGVRITTGVSQGAWVRLGLAADLSRPLSAVAGRPLTAAAQAHFGGFDGRSYAAILDPASPYYQAWVGAYVVFADEGPAFGYDEHERPQPEAARWLLEADQRLVLAAAGYLPLDDSRPRLEPIGDLKVENAIAWGGGWTKVTGSARTVSFLERGGRSAGWRARWLYGTVPDEVAAPVEDFHPIVGHGSLWFRYDSGLAATLCKFYVYSEYTGVDGEPWVEGARLVPEMEAALDGFRFDRVGAGTAGDRVSPP